MPPFYAIIGIVVFFIVLTAGIVVRELNAYNGRRQGIFAAPLIMFAAVCGLMWPAALGVAALVGGASGLFWVLTRAVRLVLKLVLRKTVGAVDDPASSLPELL